MAVDLGRLRNAFGQETKDFATYVQWMATAANAILTAAEGGIDEREEVCPKCKSEGVQSCQPFPCEHGGHPCGACNGTGTVTQEVVVVKVTNTGRE